MAINTSDGSPTGLKKVSFNLYYLFFELLYLVVKSSYRKNFAPAIDQANTWQGNDGFVDFVMYFGEEPPVIVNYLFGRHHYWSTFIGTQPIDAT